MFKKITDWGCNLMSIPFMIMGFLFLLGAMGCEKIARTLMPQSEQDSIDKEIAEEESK